MDKVDKTLRVASCHSFTQFDSIAAALVALEQGIISSNGQHLPINARINGLVDPKVSGKLAEV